MCAFLLCVVKESEYIIGRGIAFRRCGKLFGSLPVARQRLLESDLDSELVAGSSSTGEQTADHDGVDDVQGPVDGADDIVGIAEPLGEPLTICR